MRALALAAVILLLPGCAAFTKPTGTITIERQEFINTWAVTKVLYKRMRTQAAAVCVADTLPRRLDKIDCADLASIDRKAKVIAIQVEAKIETPESEIDWAVVKDFLSLLVGLVP